MHAPSNLIGSVIDGSYKVTAVIGQGGMGIVYVAEQTGLAREVVIKVLNINLSKEHEFVERFHREARILAAIENPHIVKIYSSGLLAGEVPYLVMEQVQGIPLADILSKLEKLEWERVFKIGIQICDAMSTAHSVGVLHRDLKPSNIMISGTPEDSVKVIDFGLGCFLGSDSTTLTRDGTVLGSPQYMSPEVCSGERSDERGDVYSLACLLYECITGARPFRADNSVALLYQHRFETPALMSSYFADAQMPFPELDAVIFKGLEKTPDKRYASMAEFKDAMLRMLNRQTLKFDPFTITGLSKPGNASRNSASVITKAIIGAALLLTVSAIVVLKMNPAHQQAEADPDSAEGMLRSVARLQKKALKEDSSGNASRAREDVYKSLRLFVKELTMKRDASALQKQESQIMDEFKKLVHLIPPDEDKHQLIHLSEMISREKRASRFYNQGELCMLAGKTHEYLQDYYRALDYYLQASRAFAEAKENPLSDMAMKTARDLEERRNANVIRPFIKARLILAEAANSLAQGNERQALELMSQFERQNYLKNASSVQVSIIQVRAGEIFQKLGELGKAKECFYQAIESLKIKMQDRPYEGNDGAYLEAWQGIADIAESEKDYALAIKAHDKLAEHANAHTDVPLFMQAQEHIEELKQKQKDSRASKPH